MGFCARNTLYVICLAYVFLEIFEVGTDANLFRLVRHIETFHSWPDFSRKVPARNTNDCASVPDLHHAVCPDIRTGTIIKSSCSMKHSQYADRYILIVSHSQTGVSMGLVLNGEHISVSGNATVLYGGPQETQKRFQLHSDGSLLHSRRIAEGLYFGGDMRITPAGKVAVFHGAVYWPGTLSQEAARGDWVIASEASAAAIFDKI